MKRQPEAWRIDHIMAQYSRIEFPEYQREPNLWSRAAKQRLIDSMLRNFDIASIYLYKNSDNSLECIDGRQRLGAIASFFGASPDDQDNGFALRISNEIEEESQSPYLTFDGQTYKQVLAEAAIGNSQAKMLVDQLESYAVSVVLLSEATKPGEFNLQFTRLNLGTIINSGEKLHAMIGDARDACFAENGLGSHPLLSAAQIPTRRFSREQLAAQILTQIFSIQSTGTYTRTRYFDLQHFFRATARFGEQETRWLSSLRKLLDDLHPALARAALGNRAIVVSIVILAHENRIKEVSAEQFGLFVEEFLCRLRWQGDSGADVAPEYEEMRVFQRHVTQASVERRAVEARAAILRESYKYWLASNSLPGDDGYIERTSADPTVECRKREGDS